MSTETTHFRSPRGSAGALRSVERRPSLCDAGTGAELFPRTTLRHGVIHFRIPRDRVRCNRIRTHHGIRDRIETEPFGLPVRRLRNLAEDSPRPCPRAIMKGTHEASGTG
ncbi:hypothetical protein [Rhodococcus sp. OK519]|uniref:hypothetical protein n=1 Tax=Rhodococcus sp. OK519 TaxID=2135729 RepID=UPI0011B2306E